MVGLVAVGGLRGAHRACPLAGLPYRRCPPSARSKTRPWLRCTGGGALAGVPHCRRADRLTPPHEPHRLDLLWHGTTLRSTALHHSVRRLRAGGEFSVAWRGVRSLVLDIGRVREPYLGGLPDAAVPRWAATVSSVADCGVGGALGGRVGRTRGRVHAGRVAHSLLR